MRVGLVCPYSWDVPGGVRSHVADLAVALQDHGHDISVLAPVAQEAVLRLALDAGDQAEAARRYGALFLRNTTPDELLRELGPAVLGEPGGAGQRTMADIVAGGERWHENFLQRGPQVMPPAAFAAIAAGAIKQGAVFDCTLLEQSISAVEQREAGAAAQLRTASTTDCRAD